MISLSKRLTATRPSASRPWSRSSRMINRSRKNYRLPFTPSRFRDGRREETETSRVRPRGVEGPHDRTQVVEPDGGAVRGAGDVNRGEGTVTQQKAVDSTRRVREVAHYIAAVVDPPLDPCIGGA